MSETEKKNSLSKMLTSGQNLFSLAVSVYLVIVSSLVVNDINAYRDRNGDYEAEATDSTDDGVANHDMMALGVTTLILSVVYVLWNLYFSMQALCNSNHTDLVLTGAEGAKKRNNIMAVSGFQTVVVTVLTILYVVLWGAFEHDRVENGDSNVWQGDRTHIEGAGSASDLPTLSLIAWVALAVNLLTCLIDLALLCRKRVQQ